MINDVTFVRNQGHYATSFIVDNSTSAGGLVNIPSAVATPFIFGTGDWTVEFYLYLYVRPFYSMTLIDFRAGTDATICPVIYITPNRVLAYRVNALDRITGTTTLNPEQWYHVAVSRASSVTRLFLDGVQQGSNFSDTNNYTVQSSSNPVSIMRSTNTSSATGFACNGAISNLRISRGTGAGYYTANFTPSTVPLTSNAQTSLLTCNNSTLVDTGPNNYQVLDGRFALTTYNPQIDYLTSPFTGSTVNSAVSKTSSLISIEASTRFSNESNTVSRTPLTLLFNENNTYQYESYDVNRIAATLSSSNVLLNRNINKYIVPNLSPVDPATYYNIQVGSSGGGTAGPSQYWS